MFYRLSSNTVKLVPLRERKEDILLYVNEFIKDFNVKYQKNVKGLSQTLMAVFMNYEWKGNVRELKHVIESMASLSEENIMTIQHLPAYMQDRIDLNHKKSSPLEHFTPEPIMPLHDVLNKKEREMIEKALIRTKGQLTKAADLLCIPRQTMKYRIDRLNIKVEEFK